MKININDVLKYYMIPLLKFYKLYRKIARRFFEYKKWLKLNRLTLSKFKICEKEENYNLFRYLSRDKNRF